MYFSNETTQFMDANWPTTISIEQIAEWEDKHYSDDNAAEHDFNDEFKKEFMYQNQKQLKLDKEEEINKESYYMNLSW